MTEGFQRASGKPFGWQNMSVFKRRDEMSERVEHAK